MEKKVVTLENSRRRQELEQSNIAFVGKPPNGFRCSVFEKQLKSYRQRCENLSE